MYEYAVRMLGKCLHLYFNPVHIFPRSQNLLTAFQVTAVSELVLGANKKIDNVQRLKWNVEGGDEWVWIAGGR